MTVGLLGTAASGLQAFQRAISTTGHNISNANTEGYSRQRVELGTRPPSFTGEGYIGNGVQVQTIERMFDEFVTDRLRSSTSSSAQYETLALFSERVSNLLGDSEAGLNGGLESFFDSVQVVADDPSSIPARQLMLAEAGSLVTRFQNLDTQLDSLRDELNGNVGNLVSEINSLTSAIADTNKNIVDASRAGTGQPPNDLLDQRDRLIDQLSSLVSVSTVEQDDGAVNVFVGSGQALVTRFSAAPLAAIQNDFDSRRQEITITTGSGATVITDSLTGGQLGSVLDVRDHILNPAQNALGRIAVTVATEFNRQHSLGMDLNGAMGQDFFDVGNPLVSDNARNIGNATVTAGFDSANIGALTTDDYVLSFDGTAWNLARSLDGQPVAMSGAGTPASPFTAEGMSLVISGGAPGNGDRYLIRPTRNGSASTGVLVDDTRRIAAAAPVRISEATNINGLPTNSGSGALNLQNVDNSFTPLVAGITFTYDAGAQQFNYVGDAAGSFAYDPATDNGTVFTVAGVSFSVTGTPADSDSFTISANSNGSGDNHNALLLAGLQTVNTMENGASSFQDAYGQLVGDLGSQTRSAQVTAEAQGALLNQAQASRDSLSGVNLDEEAANLLRFQQAYQAVAQVISVADSTFQTLLSAVGR